MLAPELAVEAAAGRAVRVVVAGHVDHGKSTLIGRLMYDLGLLDASRVADVVASSSRRGTAPEWSYVLDSLQEERDQAITIDTTRLWFSHAGRRYTLIDAPGHRQFLANMLSGASEADGALLVVDAAAGIGDQTLRHAYLLGFLGIKHVVVALNKIDLLAEPAARVAELTRELHAVLGRTPPAAVVPISASNGTNVAARSASTPWYDGPSVLEALAGFQATAPVEARPLRIAVQDVYRRAGERIVVGTVASGELSAGRELALLPANERVRVERLVRWPSGSPASASAGDNVGIVLSGDRFVGRGDTLADPDRLPVVARELDADAFWLAAEPPRGGEVLRLKRGTQDVRAAVSAVEDVYDIEAGRAAHAGAAVQHNIVRLRLHASAPVAFDRRDEDAAGSRSVLLRGDTVVAIGFTVGEARGAAAGDGVVRPLRRGAVALLAGDDRAVAADVVRELRVRGIAVSVVDVSQRKASVAEIVRAIEEHVDGRRSG
jgi:bifunctional enzyme CysN/CysC